MTEYLTRADCVAARLHLTDCDRDGFCNFCGEQETVGAHGGTVGVDLAVWCGDDPALALVTADQRSWQAAHPCVCEALCICDEDPEGKESDDDDPH